MSFRKRRPTHFVYALLTKLSPFPVLTLNDLEQTHYHSVNRLQ